MSDRKPGHLPLERQILRALFDGREVRSSVRYGVQIDFENGFRPGSPSTIVSLLDQELIMTGAPYGTREPFMTYLLTGAGRELAKRLWTVTEKALLNGHQISILKHVHDGGSLCREAAGFWLKRRSGVVVEVHPKTIRRFIEKGFAEFVNPDAVTTLLRLTPKAVEIVAGGDDAPADTEDAPAHEVGHDPDRGERPTVPFRTGGPQDHDRPPAA